MAPGTYVVSLIEMRASDLGAEPVILPLSTAQAIRLHAPATGCSYGGTVNVTYGRLPAGSQQKQQDLVEHASNANHENYSFVYRPDGGFVMAGVGVTLPAPDQRPVPAQACTAEKFALVKA